MCRWKNVLIYYLGRRNVVSCRSAVCNISASPKLPGGNKYNYNRKKETSSVLKKDRCLVKDCYWWSVERGWKRATLSKVSFTLAFVCLSEQTLPQPTKWERKSEDCKDALQHLPLGKAQPDSLEAARKKGCWVLCWVSIVPLAISARGQEVTLTACRFATFSLKSELFWRKGETKIKHKGIKKRSNVQRQTFTRYHILPPSHSSAAGGNAWVSPSRFCQMLPYRSYIIHFQKTTGIKMWREFCDHLASYNLI